MQTIWVHRDIGSPAATLWRLLTEPDHWPGWGPSVQQATFAGGRLHDGARGTVTTVLGVTLPFEVTVYDEGRRWAWKVAGVPATDHTVQELGPDRCRVGFGVPWPAAPYLAICRVALGRLEALATKERANS